MTPPSSLRARAGSLVACALAALCGCSDPAAVSPDAAADVAADRVASDIARDALSADTPADDVVTDRPMDAPNDSPDAAPDAAPDAPLDAASDTAPDAPSDAADAADGPRIVMGCPAWDEPIARPGDAPAGDTLAGFAQPFFNRLCVSCHSTRLLTAKQRSGAPDGLNWDDPDSIRANLDRIRRAVGVDNYMPIRDPRPTCDERRRLVRWVDLGAP